MPVLVCPINVDERLVLDILLAALMGGRPEIIDILERGRTPEQC
jgi:hypothetical protein